MKNACTQRRECTDGVHGRAPCLGALHLPQRVVQQLRRRGQVPVRVGDVRVPEVGRQLRQVALDIDAAFDTSCSSVLMASRWRRSCRRGPRESPAPRKPISCDNLTKVHRTHHSVSRVPRSETKKLGVCEVAT